MRLGFRLSFCFLTWSASNFAVTDESTPPDMATVTKNEWFNGDHNCEQVMNTSVTFLRRHFFCEGRKRTSSDT
jgi:hypothetical protein